MKWVTRKNAKVDRIACPWLVRRFVDPDADFLFVPADQVMTVAEREEAIPYDVMSSWATLTAAAASSRSSSSTTSTIRPSVCSPRSSTAQTSRRTGASCRRRPDFTRSPTASRLSNRL